MKKERNTKLIGLTLITVLTLSVSMAIYFRVTPLSVLLDTYSANAVWIYNQGWVAMNKDILTRNLTRVVNDLANNHIKFAFVFVGYWSAPATIDYQHDAAYYRTIIDAFHSVGIKAIAWAESYNAKMDITAANRQNIYDAIIECMNIGFDGYNDDIESVADFVTHQDKIDYWNGLTPLLHAMNPPRLNMPDVGYDWQQNTNMYLNVDYIVTMFYSSRSTFEDPQAPYYWQENFGMYQGKNSPPASPLILGIMNYYGNRYPLAWQLAKASEYIKTYGAPQLAGFSFWLYEYMGTNPDDWEQWNYWITHDNPTLNTVTVKSSPTPIQFSYNGKQYYTPHSSYTFTGTSVISVPSEVSGEKNNVLFGAADHSGGQQGYPIYTYASGPYQLNYSAVVNSIYIYTPLSGNVKLAIYNAQKYSIPGWVGTDYHPYQLLSKSQPTSCMAESWNLISIPTVSLSPGVYFIAIKGDTNRMIGASGLPITPVEGAKYGYDQFIKESYDTDFSQTFPQVEGAMGNDASVYVPLSEVELTPYYFVKWNDGSTSPTRTITINSDIELIALYSTTPIETPTQTKLPVIEITIVAVIILLGIVLSYNPKK